MPILCHINDLDDPGTKGFEVNGEKLFVVRKGDEVFVYRNSCPHLGLNLDFVPDDFLSLEKDYIQCSTHGALFEIENGYCVAGPCRKRSLEAVEFEVVEGKIHTLE